MADRQHPEQQDEGGLRAELAVLTRRVWLLEQELDTLKRGVARESVPSNAAPIRTTVEPPPVAAPVVASAVASAPAPVIWPAPPAAKETKENGGWQGDSRQSLESKLGAQVFNLVGIVVLIIGAAYFLKLAIDRGWLGPMARVVVGLVAGAGLVVWSERFRAKGYAAFSYSLKALGSGVLYLALWAAFHLYHLLPANVAFGAMVLVTAWNAWMAWAQDSQLLAAYALAGGFLTPVLLSSGGNHEVFLFSYLLAIDLATVVLVRLKPWPKLLLGAFPLTMLFFVAWYSEYFHADEMLVTSLFILLFDSTFSSVAVRTRVGEVRARAVTLIEDILLPLANSAFLGLAFFSVLQDTGHHDLLPWLMVVLATVYLGFMRLPQTAVASAIHLSIGIVFLTIAVPLKASGHWITVSWLVEGLALLWVASRLAPDPVVSDEESSEATNSYASGTLRWLGSASLVLGFCSVFFHALDSRWEARSSLFNSNTGTALVGIVVFAAVAWLGLRGENDARTRIVNWPSIAVAGFLAIDMIGALLTAREVLFSWSVAEQHPPLQTADFATALVGLAVFAGVVAVSLRLAMSATVADAGFWPACAGFSTIAFNLIAVLTGVREIEALFPVMAAANQYVVHDFDAGLKQALAISGFLMLYGAGLLAVGFWKRNAFLRWQALGLLVFTIFKTFLYDMRDLSQGYRVVSFLGLGVVLMTISFAYQKDWLGLKQPLRQPATGGEPEAPR
jgi:uncharacterized membrane protein